MKSLGTRLALVISSIILVLVVLLTVRMDHIFTQAIEQQGVEQAEVNAQTLLGSLKTLMLNGNGILAREWIERLHGVAGIKEIEVFRRDGSPAFNDLDTVEAVNEFLGHTRFQRHIHNPRRPMKAVPVNVFEKALAGNIGQDLSQPGVITVLTPIQADVECLTCHGYDSSMLRGVLKLSVSSEAITERIAEMKGTLWVGALSLVAILAAALYFSLRSNVLMPIKELRTAIKSAGGGDRNAQINVTRQDELGELASVFNQMQKDLSRSESRIRAVMDNIVDGVLTLREDGVIDAVNPAVEHIFGYNQQELIGSPADILVSDEAENFLLSHDEPGERKVIVDMVREVTGKKKNGASFPMDLAVSNMQLDDELFYIAIIRDITSRKARIAALHYQALHDALTGLPNRNLLLDRLQQAIRAAERGKHKLTIILLDLDRFKEVNDTLGHHVGDKLLCQIAQRLVTLLRESDTVARLGGDEFCLLLPTADTAEAQATAAKVMREIEKTIYVEGQSLVITSSLGIASYPTHGQTPLVLLRRADVAMYFAKRNKKGCAVYDSTYDENSLRQLAITYELRDAIDSDQLVLYYQPKVDLKLKRVSGVEALVRWNHPIHGLLLPDEFVPLAEQTGLIKPLTMWVLSSVLKECIGYIKEGGDDISVSINLSMTDLSDADFADELMSILEPHDINMGMIKLEITETALMHEPENVIKALHKLSAFGMKISIDDFGIGYSSLAYLQKLPVNELKIDKSFGLSLVNDKNSAVIVRSTIDLAHTLGLLVVAEGVETKEALGLLSDLGCDAVQGFYLGRPMPQQEMLKWVSEQDWEALVEIIR